MRIAKYIDPNKFACNPTKFKPILKNSKLAKFKPILKNKLSIFCFIIFFIVSFYTFNFIKFSSIKNIDQLSYIENIDFDLIRKLNRIYKNILKEHKIDNNPDWIIIAVYPKSLDFSFYSNRMNNEILYIISSHIQRKTSDLYNEKIRFFEGKKLHQLYNQLMSQNDSKILLNKIRLVLYLECKLVLSKVIIKSNLIDVECDKIIELSDFKLEGDVRKISHSIAEELIKKLKEEKYIK